MLVEKGLPGNEDREEKHVSKLGLSLSLLSLLSSSTRKQPGRKSVSPSMGLTVKPY